MEQKTLSWEQLMEGFAEIRELQRKNEEERKRLQEENARGFAELHALQKKNEEENAEGFKKLREALDLTRQDLSGISDSNGKFSESYFYNSLYNTMSFGGKDFDEIEKGMKRVRKLPNGEKLKGEYDVVMYNGDTVALIEIKHRVRQKDLNKLLTTQIDVFKRLFPQYANHKFFLGIAGLSFEDNCENEALEKGIAILRPKGENVEILDKNLKVY